MSEKKQSVNRLATVVDDFLDDNQLHNSFWPKALKWAQRAVREIRLDIYQEPKTVLLPVTERFTAILPDNYVDWVKMAVPRGQYAITLAINDDLMSLPRTGDENTVRGLLSQHMPNGLDFNAYGGYYFFNYDGGTLNGYGCGLPSKGYVKVVDHGGCKEIQMDYDFRYNQIYLEYITDGLSPCQETLIHPYEYDYIMKFMEELFERKNNPKATNQSKYEAGRDVFFAEKKLRARYNNMSPKDVLVMSRAEARFTTKL